MRKKEDGARGDERVQDVSEAREVEGEINLEGIKGRKQSDGLGRKQNVKRRKKLRKCEGNHKQIEMTYLYGHHTATGSVVRGKEKGKWFCCSEGGALKILDEEREKWGERTKERL